MDITEYIKQKAALSRRFRGFQRDDGWREMMQKLEQEEILGNLHVVRVDTDTRVMADIYFRPVSGGETGSVAENFKVRFDDEIFILIRNYPPLNKFFTSWGEVCEALEKELSL
jgi:hypothetical protein